MAFLQEIPKPPKPVCKRFCAVLRQQDLDNRQILICKTLIGGDDIPEWFEDSFESLWLKNWGAVKWLNKGDREREEHEAGKKLSNMELLNRLDEKDLKDRLENPIYKGRSMKERYLELGNDYENIQVIPTGSDMAGEFVYIFRRSNWQERYMDWRIKSIQI